jgi:ADP-ribosyl-[dinitrogen reductase] hydrolase
MIKSHSATNRPQDNSGPIELATLQFAPSYGKIGLCFCPGKKQVSAMSGFWDRDLDADLDAIAEWNASAVVTLIEDHEFAALEVEGLGDAVRLRHMDWYHLPIRDVSVPGPALEKAWATVGAQLRQRLQNGFNVVIHCKGGIGRAGTIAARLLVEFGMNPNEAIAAVRAVRPGAIETAEQERYVLKQSLAMASVPDTSAAAIRDRAVGALLGLAIGDAVGTTLEFKSRDSYPMLTDMVGGGPFRLKPGQWTDDTALALALADCLLTGEDLDEADLLRRFVEWHEQGTYSCTGHCFDIGTTTSQGLRRWRQTGSVVAGANDSSAGNGSLMRLAPVAVRFWRDRAKLRDIAARQSRTTHGAHEAVDACVAYAEALADAIEGQPMHEVLRARTEAFAGRIAGIMAGSWRGMHRDQVKASGYVAHSLEASLWSVGRTGTYKDAVLLAANLGDDADTTAAIAGQLAGALYGADALPEAWRARVAWGPRITTFAHALFDS